ncbi:hypothetical protein Taro_041703 [Colocasia esculenta]|uniref:TRAF-type domain-containing protein n=1 Tax=Colocasia esculenta TaxID=4460 RepID=A0A843WQN7_COLES|nr:hypothetical protein [Colocasia esculenta]
METNGFSRADRWVTLAETLLRLLRNLDYDNIYHYGMGLQIQACMHDSACPFKILLCKQNFGQSIIRREMDRHCIPVCTMKLVNCPFYQVGCRTDVFPQLTSPPYIQIKDRSKDVIISGGKNITNVEVESTFYLY